MADSAKLSEDGRCFLNPFFSQPACNDPAKASGEDLDCSLVSAELKARLREEIAANVTAIDEAYSHDDGDNTVYTGSPGIALLHYHLATTLNSSSPEADLRKAAELLQSSLRALNVKRFTFLCGASGPLALSALVYNRQGLVDASRQSIHHIKELVKIIKPKLSSQPSEFLYGHIGLLYSLLLVNREIPESFEDSMIVELVEVILECGVRGAVDKAPMMFSWHDKKYLGAAHGVAGILTMLLKVPIPSIQDKIKSLVQPCVDYLLSVSYPSGNLPSSLESAGPRNDRLVHWCHGAPGAVHLFTTAYKVFGERRYLDAALKCGAVVWKRGLLTKGYGLCHGVSGNAYTFIALYKATGDRHHLERAIKFTEWCLSYKDRQCRTPDSPYSLFEGLAGTTMLYIDVLTRLEVATFPAYEL